jgi:hypothetical protein
MAQKNEQVLSVSVASASSGAARISNTALDSQNQTGSHLQAGIDWLSLSFFDVDIDRLVYFLQEGLNTVVCWENPKEVRERGEVWMYFECTNGGNFGMLNRGHDRISDVRLQLSGRPLSQWSTRYLRKVCVALSKDFGARCTRIDINVDDYQRVLSFGQIWQAIESKHISGFVKAQYIKSFGGASAGETIYLGTRRSSKFGRIYDRMGVTNGQENCIRYEVEYKGKMADLVFLDFIKSDSKNVYKRLGAVIRGAFDFVIKKDKNLDRATRLEFWDNFLNRICDYVEKIKVTKKHVSIERSLSWVHRSVSKTLLILKRALEPDVFVQIIDLWMNEASHRLTIADALNIQNCQVEKLSYSEIIARF